MNVFGGLLLFLYAAFLTALLLPVQLRLNRLKYVAQALSFPLLLTLFGTFAGLVCLVVMLATHGTFWILASVISLIYMGVSFAQLLRLGLNNNAVELVNDPTAGPVIMGWNTLGDSVPVETLRDAILLHRADAVGLPETTRSHQEALVAALQDAGYFMRGYTVGPEDGYDPHETSLLIKREYGEYTTERLHVLGASTLEAKPKDPTSPTFVAVHTVAPVLDKHAAWAQDLKMLTDRYAGARRTILVGDFNATVTHMRGLKNNSDGVLGELLDSAREQNSAAYGTWPVTKPAVLGTQIDHVLHTPDYTATSFNVLTELDRTGSDHRAILASLKAQQAGRL